MQGRAWTTALLSTALLAACGVPAEEHQSTLDELAKVKAEAAVQSREARAADSAAAQRASGLAAENAALKRGLEGCKQELQAKSTQPAAPATPEVEVTVGAKDFTVAGDQVTAKGLLEALKKARAARPGAALRIRSDPAARYRAMVKLLDLAREAGFTEIGMGTK